MTVALSIAAPDMIVKAVDNAVTPDFGSSREYQQGRKLYMLPGIGCVATWDSHDGNQISNFLEHKLTEFNRPADCVLLTDLTLRFSSEITPQVACPFFYF